MEVKPVWVLWILGVPLIILGFISLVMPRTYWYLSNRKSHTGNIRPRNLALFAYRLWGIVMLAAGLAVCFHEIA